MDKTLNRNPRCSQDEKNNRSYTVDKRKYTVAPYPLSLGIWGSVSGRTMPKVSGSTKHSRPDTTARLPIRI